MITYLWFTGPSGSGKSTLALHLQKTILSCFIIDADFARELWPELKFSKEDIHENIRRLSYLAGLLGQQVEEGVVVVSCISPFKESRDKAIAYLKSLSNTEAVYEVFIKTSLVERINRDPKGLYEKALRGEISNLAGYDAPYAIPTSPNLILNGNKPLDMLVSKLLRIGDQ